VPRVRTVSAFIGTSLATEVRPDYIRFGVESKYKYTNFDAARAGANRMGNRLSKIGLYELTTSVAGL
jgi:hypothetical protein